VQWIEDRREHLTCSCHSRDQIHELEVGFDADPCGAFRVTC